MNLFFLLALGSLLMAEGVLGEKGAFERILEINLGNKDNEENSRSFSHMFEGDIKLTGEQRMNQALFGDPDGAPSRAATNVDKIKWDNAVIPYEFDCSVASIDRAVRATKEAMAEWESKTCIRFVKRTTEKNFLWFHRGMGCWCEVGKVYGRKTWLSIGNGCEYKHVMVHELGHAIGFWHEQSRPDRDNYLKIHWENIEDSMKYNFEKKKQGTEVVDYGVPYDYASIMHYPWVAFSKNGKMTMQPIKHLNGKTPYIRLSDDDALQARRMYKCPTRNVEPPPEGRAVGYALGICADRTKQADCESWKSAGFCTQHSSMLYWCKKTCEFCTSNSCQDTKFECKKLASEGKCSSDKVTMEKECPNSCNTCRNCTNPSPTICKDTTNTADCEGWKRAGFCTAHEAMIFSCKKTCEFCSSDACLDTKSDCKARATRGECSSDAVMMELECSHTCGFCDECTQLPTFPPTVAPTLPPIQPNRTGVGLICVDKRQECPTWASQGDCAKNGYTEMACRISCRTRCDSYPIKPNGTCSNAFGLGWPGNYQLPDSAFSASTEYRPAGWSAGADNARLYFEDDEDNKRMGAWCATDRDNQWLKVDLGKNKKVRAIATQGRHQFHEHVKDFKLAFSTDGSNFQVYQEGGQEKTFTGNCDHFTPVINTFNAVTARYVKIFVGKSSYPCMRVELYGCDV